LSFHDEVHPSSFDGLTFIVSRFTIKYSGIIVPAVTPLTADHKLDHEAVEKMFANFYRHDVMPFILGTTGEAASLSSDVKDDYIQFAAKCKKPGSVLYAGISSNCLYESIELAKKSFDAGIDVVAATLPSYYLLTEDQMKKYFEQLANGIAGPVIIYNIPATTHMSIPLKVIDELSHHENIVGCKDSERSEERLKESIALWNHREDFSHFVGWAAKSAEALLNGSGLIPSTGNLHPGLYKQILQAAQSGDTEKTYGLQRLSDVLGNLYQGGRTLGESLWALKVLMKQAGLCEPNVMPPLQPLSADETNKLLSGLQEIINKEGIEL
jgi:dihydrodipicolinate synthase/N-acetylneuraminate lyase